MGEWREKKFKGVVVPVCGVYTQYLKVVKEYCGNFQTSKIVILDIFPDYACEFFDDIDYCFEDDCPHNVNGKCNPPKYEVEILIRYRRVVGGEPQAGKGDNKEGKER